MRQSTDLHTAKRLSVRKARPAREGTRAASSAVPWVYAGRVCVNADRAPRELVDRWLGETFHGAFDDCLRAHHRRWKRVMDFDEYRQCVLFRAWRRARTFQPHSKGQWLAWLRRIGHTIAANEVRRQKHKASHEAEWALLCDRDACGAATAAATVERLLADLSAEEACLVRWRFLDGHSFADIATYLDSPWRPPGRFCGEHYGSCVATGEFRKSF